MGVPDRRPKVGNVETLATVSVEADGSVPIGHAPPSQALRTPPTPPTSPPTGPGPAPSPQQPVSGPSSQTRLRPALSLALPLFLPARPRPRPDSAQLKPRQVARPWRWSPNRYGDLPFPRKLWEAVAGRRITDGRRSVPLTLSVPNCPPKGRGLSRHPSFSGGGGSFAYKALLPPGTLFPWQPEALRFQYREKRKGLYRAEIRCGGQGWRRMPLGSRGLGHRSSLLGVPADAVAGERVIRI